MAERLDRYSARPQSVLAGEPGARAGIVALGLGVVGLALVITVLAHRWPEIWSPPRAGGEDHGYNLRLLKGMVQLEGIGLAAL